MELLQMIENLARIGRTTSQHTPFYELFEMDWNASELWIT